jgi:hypothetical protein
LTDRAYKYFPRKEKVLSRRWHKKVVEVERSAEPAMDIDQPDIKKQRERKIRLFAALLMAREDFPLAPKKEKKSAQNHWSAARYISIIVCGY